MNICFVDGTSIINRVHRIDLGKLTCEQLNARGWDAYAGLQAHLDFFFPSDNATASEFLASLEATRSEITRMKTMLASNRYYQLNDEAANTFATIEHLLEDTCQQVQKKMHSGADYVVDLGIEINTTALNVASTYTDTLFATHVNAVRIFTELVEAVMIQNDAFPQRHPIDRLHAYGFDRFQEQVQELLKESETASSSAYAPDFEMHSLEDGSVRLAPLVGINNVAQLMYHELMNMIMQGHSIRRCKNCGKYFVQYGDRVVDYCDEIPEGETKACKTIGSSRHFTASLKDDPIKQTYTRAYKKYVARRRLKTVSEGQFATWSAEAKKLRQQAYATGMHEETFRQMLDDLMAKITGN